MTGQYVEVDRRTLLRTGICLMASKSTVPLAWTVGDLGAFYTQHRAELHAHASRVLKDQIKSEEITQDALIKFMLAAPKFESEEHALWSLTAIKRPKGPSCSAWSRPQHAQTLNTPFTLAYPID